MEGIRTKSGTGGGKEGTVRDSSLRSRWINYADRITGKKEVGALGKSVNRERQRGQIENESRRSGRKEIGGGAVSD